MSLEAEITHTDDSTDTVYPSRTEEEYEFEHMDIASVFVDRKQVNEITLEEGDDEVEIIDDGERLFGGVLRDVVRGGGEAELVLDSYERYALDGERSSGDLVYENADDTDVYDDAIADIPEVDEGTVEGIDDAVTFVFSYTSPAKRIRTVAESVGAEVLYQPDKTVDIVDSLGEDKTEGNDGTPLKPSEQNISGDFNPERVTGEKEVTHLIMLGAGEGSAQVQATVVPEDDSKDYDEDKYANVRRYEADDWEDGDRKKWASRTNKDLTDEETLGDLGETLIEEYNAEFLDVEVTVEDEDVALGDEFTVRHPDEDVDLDLRAVDVTRIIDSGGRRYEVTFSNRRLTRESDEEKRVKDTERYNRAFEGSAVMLNTGGGRQPVDPDNGIYYSFSFYYPDEVVYEHRVKLFVRGDAYRAYSRGAASSGGQHSHNVSIGDHTHEVSIGDHTHEVSIDDHDHDVSISDHDHDIDLDDHTHEIEIKDHTHDVYYDEHDHEVDIPSHSHDFSYYTIKSHDHPIEITTNTIEADGDGHFHTINDDTGFPPSEETESSTTDSGGATVETTDDGGGGSATSSSGGGTTETTDSGGGVETTTSNGGGTSTTTDDGGSTTVTSSDGGSTTVTSSDGGSTSTTSSDSTPKHTHDPEPGVVLFSDDYPSECDVEVNGSSLDVSLGDGDGTFEEEVDLAGELNPGQVNEIEITSETLGHIQAHLDVDVYRQILGRG